MGCKCLSLSVDTCDFRLSHSTEKCKFFCKREIRIFVKFQIFPFWDCNLYGYEFIHKRHTWPLFSEWWWDIRERLKIKNFKSYVDEIKTQRWPWHVTRSHLQRSLRLSGELRWSDRSLIGKSNFDRNYQFTCGWESEELYSSWKHLKLSVCNSWLSEAPFSSQVAAGNQNSLEDSKK